MLPGRGQGGAPALVSGRVVAGIAHDLKNLLTAIAQGCEWTLARDGMPADDHAQLATIQATAVRAVRLATQLMCLARGEGEAQPVALDIDAALASLRVPLAGMLGQDISLEVRSACAGACVHIDPVAFERVLFNLAGNARQAMPTGGRVVIEAAPCTESRIPHGAEGGSQGRRWLGITVTDDGEGIADAVRARLFEPDVTTRRDAGGCGLGLATVRGIVEAAGGRIAAENVPGGGACFRIALPVLDPTSTSAGAEATARPAPLRLAESGDGAGVILLVEDEDAVRGLAARVLTGSGFRVIEAGSAEDALAEITRAEAAARDDAIDLLIADLMLPGMDGRALAREIRRHRAGVPVILVSGYAEGDSGCEGLARDGLRFLEKPFSLADLLAAVSDALTGG